MIELKGSRRGVGLLPIVQLLAGLEATGQLHVACGVARGQLEFETGRLVAAAWGELRGVPALAPLDLAFPEADFAFVEGPPQERDVDLTLDQLVRLGLIRVAAPPPVRQLPRRRALLARGLGVCLLIGVAAAGLLLLNPSPPAVPPPPTPSPPAVAAPHFAPPDTPPVPTPEPQTPPAAAAIPRPTPAPPRVTFAASNPEAQTGGGRTLLESRFTDRPVGWLQNPPFAYWADGAYRLVASEPQRFVAVAAPLDSRSSDMADLIVSATLRKVGGPPGGGYGLIVHDEGASALDGIDQSGNFYVLAVGDRGEVGAWRRSGTTWVDIMPWTVCPAVRSGGSPNTLLVETIGDRLVFQVNAVEVLSAEIDTDADTGRVGLFVGGDANAVALDHFSVRTPD